MAPKDKDVLVGKKMKEVQETSLPLPPSGPMQLVTRPPSAPVETLTPPQPRPSGLVQTPILSPNGPSSLQFPMQAQFFPPNFATAPRPEFNNFQSPKALQDSMPFNLKLYASLLTEHHVPDFLIPIINEQNEEIDQMIIAHGEWLKRAIANIQQRQFTSLLVAAEEIEAKKLKEKECEMLYMKMGWEQRQASARTEVEYWKNRISHWKATKSSLQPEVEHCKNQASQWEATASSLQSEVEHWKSRASNAEAALRSLESDVDFWKKKAGRWEAKASCPRSARHGAEGAGSSETGEQAGDHQTSSHVEANRVEPVKIVCRVCGKRVATMMIWPCRHVCLCKKCDDRAETCPVCRITKAASHEVYL